jgi:methyl-accepting chemotaxis protein
MVSDEMDVTLRALQSTSRSVEALAIGLTEEVSDLNLKDRINEVGEVLRRVKSVMTLTDRILKNTQDDLSPALENFKIMTENLREFSETAKRYPSQIIFGQPPKEVKP